MFKNQMARVMMLLALSLGTMIPMEAFAGGGSHGCQQQQAPCRQRQCVQRGRCGSGRCFKRSSRCARRIRGFSISVSRCGSGGGCHRRSC